MAVSWRSPLRFGHRGATIFVAMMSTKDVKSKDVKTKHVKSKEVKSTNGK